MQTEPMVSQMSDDEEDLESLRLAALQSLKRPVQATEPVQVSSFVTTVTPFPLAAVSTQIVSKQQKQFGTRKRHLGHIKPFHHGNSRGARNGTFSRVRVSNLISVPTIPTDEPVEDAVSTKNYKDSPVPKLILPQDRYCNVASAAINVDSDNSDQATSKFDRYNNSSDSDSDSEDEKNLPQQPSFVSQSPPKKVVSRTTSLEDLMQQLDEEILGNCTPKEKSDDVTFQDEEEAKTTKPMKIITVMEKEDSDSNRKLIEDKIIVTSSKSPVKAEKKRPLLSRENKAKRAMMSEKRPLYAKNENLVSFNGNGLSNHASEALPYSMPPQPVVSASQLPPPVYHQPAAAPYLSSAPVTFDPYTYSNPYPSIVVPGDAHSTNIGAYPSSNHTSSLMPLEIKTDILDTVSAPLSPRSAAFVLQNREIIERRKKSPLLRRSYSPSSPEHRRRYPKRSKSPSPLRSGTRSRRMSPASKKPHLYKSRRSPPYSSQTHVSPKDRTSPHHQVGKYPPAAKHLSPLLSSHTNRSLTMPILGSNAARDDDVKDKDRSRHSSLSLSLSSSSNHSEDDETLESKPTELQQEDELGQQSLADSAFEARRKKFEENGPVLTAGIIRLKPQRNETSDGQEENEAVEDLNGNEDTEQKQEEDDEDDDDDILLGNDSDLDDDRLHLFSDEESEEDDNEGRFKSSNQTRKSQNVAVLPFSLLINGGGTSSSNKTLTEKLETEEPRRLNRGRGDRSSDRRGSRSNAGARSHKRSYHDRRDRTGGETNSSRKRHRTSTTPEKVSRSKDGEEVSKAAISESERRSASDRRKVSDRVKTPSSFSRSSAKRKSPIVSPIESKKIEIKIRNPSKYEDSTIKEKGGTKARKVRLTELEEGQEEDEYVDTESLNVSGTDEDLLHIKSDSAGDLRAQLSRKRAERQHKGPKLEGIPSRILQSALQGAVYKKSDLKTQESSDKKRPVHMRLGIPAGSSDVVATSTAVCDVATSNQKSGKRTKYKGNVEQV